MDTGDAIAIYAAVVATFAALWPVWQAHRARRPPVEVALGAAREQDEQRTRLVVIEVRNHGATRVRIRAVGLMDGKAMWTFQPGSLAVGSLAGPRIQLHVKQEFPREVPPQETRAFVLPENFVQLGKNLGPMLGSPRQAKSLALDIQRPLQAWVWLETGQTVNTRARLDWSEPWELAEDPDELEGRSGEADAHP
jgi:hypothetical protein